VDDIEVAGALVDGGTLVAISIVVDPGTCGSDDEVAVALVIESRLKLNLLLLA
jgi:hypothetical protein